MQSHAPRSGAKSNTQLLKPMETISPTQQLITPPPGTPMAAGLTAQALREAGTSSHFTGTPRTAHLRATDRSGAMSTTSLTGAGIGASSSLTDVAGNGNSPIIGGRLTGESDDHLPYSIIHSLSETTAAHAAAQQEGGPQRHHGAHHYSSSGGTAVSSSGRLNVPSPKSGGPAFPVGISPSPAETPTPNRMDEFDRMLKETGTPAGNSRRVSTSANPTSSASKSQQPVKHRPSATRLVHNAVNDEMKKKQLLLEITQVLTSLAPHTQSSSVAAQPSAPSTATPRVSSAQGSQQQTPRVGPVTPSQQSRVSPIQPTPQELAAPPSAGIPSRQRSGLGFSSPPPQGGDSDALFRIAQAAVKSTCGINGNVPNLTANGQHNMPGIAPHSTSPQGQWPRPPSAGERGTIDGEMMTNAKRIHFDPSTRAPVKFSAASGSGKPNRSGAAASGVVSKDPQSLSSVGAGGLAMATTTTNHSSRTPNDRATDPSSNASSSGSSIVCKPKQSHKTLELVASTLAAHDSKTRTSRRKTIKSESSAFSETTEGTKRSAHSGSINLSGVAKILRK